MCASGGLYSSMACLGKEWRMATGKVTWFNDQKGFGFITAEDGVKEFFVHHSAMIEGQGIQGRCKTGKQDEV